MSPHAHYRRNNLIVAVMIVLLIGLTVLVGIRIYQLHHIDTTAPSTKIVNDVFAAVGNNIPVVKRQQPPAAFDPNWKDPGESPGTLTYTISAEQNGDAPIRKLAGYDYYVQPVSTSLSFRASSTTDAQLLNKTVQAELRKHGLILQSGYKPAYKDVTVYKNDMAYCGLRIPGSSGFFTPYFDLSISCADNTSYDQTAAKLHPFVLAYTSGRPGIDTNSLLYSTPNISASKTPGYKTAGVSISEINGGGAEALFYAKDNTWHYWASTQMAAYCFEDGAGTVPVTFPSEDIHAAYKGSACMLPNGKTDTYK